MSALPLTHIARYRIVSELGRGAMGVVYKAEDPQLARTVAVKVIRIAEEADEYLARFRQESKAVGALSHPGIITIYDAGREDDIAYMAMEMLEGVELRGLLAGSRLPVPLAVDIAAQVADALAFAHRHGVVHRDIKPGNIMVLAGNRIKLLDFGIARMRVSEVKTQTGVQMGSPRYMSPEQVLARGVDHRADIFSLGVVLHEMLTGSTPFAGADLTQLMFQVVNGAATPPSHLEPGVPQVLDRIVAKALQKSAENRYQDADEMAADLRACLGSLAAEPDPSILAIAGERDATRALARLAKGDEGRMSRWLRDRDMRRCMSVAGVAAIVALLVAFS